MDWEKEVLESILTRFPYIHDRAYIAAPRQIIVNALDREHFEHIFAYFVQQLGFNHLHYITALDEGDYLSSVYIVSDAHQVMLNIKQTCPKAAPSISSVCHFFDHAAQYEREIGMLFGFRIDHLPAGPRYPLPACWPEQQYPLRKDWTY